MDAGWTPRLESWRCSQNAMGFEESAIVVVVVVVLRDSSSCAFVGGGGGEGLLSDVFAAASRSRLATQAQT